MHDAETLAIADQARAACDEYVRAALDHFVEVLRTKDPDRTVLWLDMLNGIAAIGEDDATNAEVLAASLLLCLVELELRADVLVRRIRELEARQ